MEAFGECLDRCGLVDLDSLGRNTLGVMACTENRGQNWAGSSGGKWGVVGEFR